MRFALSAISLLFLSSAFASEPEPPAFTQKPIASRDGERVRITFAASRETDVAVYIENAKGEIVRHLVAGALGKNPPEPLTANSLAQTFLWDGRDDDGKATAGGSLAAPKPLSEGGLKVRVGLGLKANWGGLAFADAEKTGPNRIESVIGLAAGPDGRLYVLDYCGAWLYWNTSRIHVLRRDGAYEKTIKPFPTSLPLERVKATGAFVNSFGAINPVLYRALGFSFYSHDDVGHQPAITPDGRIVLATRTANTHYYGDTGAVGVAHLGMLDTEGGTPEAAYAGPSLKAGWTAYPYLVSTPDGQAVYLTGQGLHNAWGAAKQPWHAIHRIKLPERGPQEVFFGDPGSSGNDNTHLNDPRGLAVDGKGHLLVADFGNNRVVVLNESDKACAGSFPVAAPTWIGFHPKTGAIYVASKEAVLKFSGWQEAKEKCRLPLPKRQNKVVDWKLALDASAEPAVLWAGAGSEILRFEDQGEKFTDPVPSQCVGTQFYWRPSTDPTRKWVSCRIGGAWSSSFQVFEEATGQVMKMGMAFGEGAEGVNLRLGPDGAIYACGASGGLCRYDADGKRKPFPATAADVSLKGRLPAGSTGTTAWDRDFWVDRKNDIYVRKSGPQYHGHMTVEVYDQEGKHKRTVLWSVSDAMYGPRVDAKGNLYIMDMIKPVGEIFPKEFQGRLTTSRAPHWYNWIYGSVIKFGPQGGAIWFADGMAVPLNYEGWRVTDTNSVSGLKTTGGSLSGTISKKPALLGTPIPTLEAATQKKLVMRLKNESDGNQAMLHYHVVGEGYGTAARTKSIEIKPNSDFAEYTFDMAEEKEWKGSLYGFSLSPTNGVKGSFSLDWFRVGEAGSNLIWNFDAEDGQEKKLPADLKKEEVAAFTRAQGNMLQGALWYRSGFSPVGMVQGNDQCHCTGSDFDMDDFGRVFAPDTGRFRVGVLDTNGNEILSFGAYGNQDYCGPESYVMDPGTKLLRPRQPSDPSAMLSPFAKPEIAFGWIVGLAVTDRYAYVDDVLNKRILRVKLDYAATETAPIP